MDAMLSFDFSKINFLFISNELCRPMDWAGSIIKFGGDVSVSVNCTEIALLLNKVRSDEKIFIIFELRTYTSINDEIALMLRNRSEFTNMKLIALTSNAPSVIEKNYASFVGVDLEINYHDAKKKLPYIIDATLNRDDMSTHKKASISGNCLFELPDVIGLDKEIGLKRAFYSEEKYFAKLREFIVEFNDFYDAQKTLFFQSQWGKIAHFASKLSDMSYFIGALKIESLANKLIIDCRKGYATDVRKTFLELSEHLTLFLFFLKNMLNKESMFHLHHD